ncbi:hypothetical protein PAI11_37590 [Patulibacter medicamentivorans]|uniref:Uncharacterized protein n=1 Tax=Patulibacter medicamentivorans TaxID=1097667 RepID=H0EA85_9ACTN|nr:hypothetical protein [Patulibacter medicamentivorans]EHN09425.1 hypothetical protein PAI11_37590 [Patulibacter medicamentivorans]
MAVDQAAHLLLRGVNPDLHLNDPDRIAVEIRIRALNRATDLRQQEIDVQAQATAAAVVNNLAKATKAGKKGGR